MLINKNIGITVLVLKKKWQSQESGLRELGKA